MHQLPLGPISFTQLAHYWHDARGSVLSSNSPELLQEPFLIPQLPLPYVPAPLLDAKPSCHGFLALTPVNKYRMVNASRALAATTGITAPALPRAVAPGGLPRDLLLAAAGGFKFLTHFLDWSLTCPCAHSITPSSTREVFCSNFTVSSEIHNICQIFFCWMKL